ncbi:BadF/BadG/BcrA/BcrD ATPase family protein [Kribbella sp. NPDC051770]|uniref:N-acetylglucosamine kinase n=1 Tax=Kribbella sp. NPDC051770 TaxID=3155413 RepID=UPI00341B2E21
MINLAIDGGQSALRLRVLPDGRTGGGPGYQHIADSRPATLAAIHTALEDAGVSSEAEVGTVALGLAGFPHHPESARALAEAIFKSLRAQEVRLAQDMVTAHAGALPDGYGVVVAAGTGLVCLAVDHEATWHKVDGGGYLFGDAGSAFAIGRAGLAAIVRARDGRGPATALAGLEVDPIDLYLSTTLAADVAAFAPEVFRLADDPVARAIIAAAVEDIAETVTTAVGALTGAAAVPVALVGGLFEGAGHQLLEPLRAHLPPRARLTTPAGNSLDGATRLATGALSPYGELVVIHR